MTNDDRPLGHDWEGDDGSPMDELLMTHDDAPSSPAAPTQLLAAPAAGPGAPSDPVPEPERGRSRHPWLFALGYGLSLGVLLVTLAIACAAIVVPRFAGAVPMTVLSNSMAPALPVGSLVIVRPTMDLAPGTDINTLPTAQIRETNRVDGLRVGDVIAFQPNPTDATVIIHRITQVSVRADGTREFITQGDNNAGPDAPVQDYMVRGQAWYDLPYLGYVNNFLNSDTGRHTVVVIVIAATGYAWAAFLLYRALKRGRDAARHA